MSKVLLCYEDFSELTNMQSVLKKVGFDVLTISSEFSLSQQMLSFNPDIVVGYGKGPKVSTVSVGRRLKEMPRWTGKTVLIFPAGSKPDPTDLARIRMDMALEAPLEVARLIQVLANLTNQNPHTLVSRMMKAVADEAEGKLRAATVEPKDGPVFVTGGPREPESWNVRGSQDLDDFNRLMGMPAAKKESAKDAKESVHVKGGASSETASPLTGGGPARDEAVSVHGDQGPTAEEAAAVRDELKQANEDVAYKVKTYEKYLDSSVSLKESSLRRTEARKAQKELRKGWNESDLKSQDELRRSFVEAMFKKKD